MRRISLAVMATTALTIAAFGAGTQNTSAAPATYNWSGFYVGINGGGAWGKSHHNFDAFGTTTGNYNVSGGLFGVTLGSNWQNGAWVYGVEGDVDWTNIKGSAPCPNPTFTCETSNNWLGTVRGRIGSAFGGVLPYLTGGLALGNIKANIPNFGSASNSKAGWTIGGGAEFALPGKWTVKAEYLYVDLGSFNCGTSCTATAVDNVNLKASIARVGLNFKF